MTTPTAFHCDKPIRFQHCDPAGIVFYPQYFVLFHELLEDWFNDGLGVDYAQFVATEKLGVPTVSLACEFIAPSQHGDTLQFSLQVRAVGRTSISLVMTAGVDDQVRVKLEQIVVLFSLDKRLPVAVPAELKEKMLRYMPEHSER